MSKNLKLINVIKSFVPESISCISGFRMFISRIHILVVFLDLDPAMLQDNILSTKKKELNVHDQKVRPTLALDILENRLIGSAIPIISWFGILCV